MRKDIVWNPHIDQIVKEKTHQPEMKIDKRTRYIYREREDKWIIRGEKWIITIIIPK